ncbi:MAG: DUF4123 domain-containing protein [bacterium]
MKLVDIEKELKLDVTRDEKLYYYMIADGVGIENLSQLLWMYDRESEILFDEKKGREILQVSPYLIVINAKTEKIVKKLVDEFYGKSTLFFATSYLDIKVLSNHLKSYITYLVLENNKREEVYVAFHDPRVLPSFLNALDEQEKEEFLSAFLTVLVEDERDVSEVKTFKGKALKDLEPRNESSFRELTLEHIQKLEDYEEQRSYFKMAKSLKNIYPNKLQEYSLSMLEQIAKERTAKMKAYGLNKYNQYYQMFAWEVFYGEDYEQNDNSGVLISILESNLSSNEKFKKYKEVFTTQYNIGDYNEWRK